MDESTDCVFIAPQTWTAVPGTGIEVFHNASGTVSISVTAEWFTLPSSRYYDWSVRAVKL